MNETMLKRVQAASLRTRTTLPADATRGLAGALNALLADVFALYIKSKNFHWHMSGLHFRDYHVMLDEHSEQVLAMTDVIAERVRKLGETTIRSVRHIAQLQSLLDNNADYVSPDDILAELRDVNIQLAGRMREIHGACEEYGDVATASFLETWIDETERRTWFLFEAGRSPEPRH
jgi:starvation-inducible DNA-binding protein